MEIGQTHDEITIIYLIYKPLYCVSFSNAAIIFVLFLTSYLTNNIVGRLTMTNNTPCTKNAYHYLPR